MQDQDTLADRLAAFRRARNLTQRQLADMAGLTQGGVAGIESGKRGVRGSIEADTLLRLAEALGVQPRELLPRDQAEKKLEKSGKSR
jgi:transcriptional regulator with XRE-family HTH domain